MKQEIKFIRKTTFEELESQINLLLEQGFKIQQYIRISNTVFPFEAVMVKEIKEKKTKTEQNTQSESLQDIVDRIIELFSLRYKELRGYEYHVSNKGLERSAAGKLLAEHKKKFPDFTAEQTLKSLEGYFNAVINISDNYIFTNMGLPIILTKFNAINTIIRNARATTRTNKKGRTTTDEQFINAIAEGYNKE